MKHIYTITYADVKDGEYDGRYRHPFGSKMRSLLVSISDKFGGIGPKDVGVKIYRAKDGQLVWGPAIGQKRLKSNPRRRSKYRVRKNYKKHAKRSKASRRRISRRGKR